MLPPDDGRLIWCRHRGSVLLLHNWRRVGARTSFLPPGRCAQMQNKYHISKFSYCYFYAPDPFFSQNAWQVTPTKEEGTSLSPHLSHSLTLNNRPYLVRNERHLQPISQHLEKENSSIQGDTLLTLMLLSRCEVLETQVSIIERDLTSSHEKLN